MAREVEGSEPTRGTRMSGIAFRVLIAAVAVLAGGLLFGIPLLVTGWFDNEAGGIHRIHTLGWAALFGLLVAVPALALLRAPERKPAALQGIIATVAAIIFGYATYSDFDFFSAAVALAVLGLLVALHPARGSVFRTGPVSPALLGVALAAAIPLFIYAWNQGVLQRTIPATDPHTAGEHWSDMAKVAAAIALVGIVAALRSPGYRIPAWYAGAAAAFLGTASLVNPDVPSSFGVGWGLVALLGGLFFVAIAEWEAARSAKPAGLSD